MRANIVSKNARNSEKRFKYQLGEHGVLVEYFSSYINNFFFFEEKFNWNISKD